MALVVPFEPHMPVLRILELVVGDRVDYANATGKFHAARITYRGRASSFKISFDNTTTPYDAECDDPVNNAHRFAKVGSISQRPAHRLKSIKIGSSIEVNIKQHPGWRKAVVTETDTHSGQIKVRYKVDISGGRKKPVSWTRWVHLDDVSQVAQYGTHSLTKEFDHVSISLETKRTYLNTSNEIKESCADEIFERVYRGKANALTHLIKNASTSELQQIQKIIKSRNIQYEESKKSADINNNEKTNCNDIENDGGDDKKVCDVSSQKISSLSQVSRDCIDHICSYLDREDIKSFKLTSFRNGIVCLKQMTKCTVGVDIINELFNPQNKNYMDMVSVVFTSSYHRYPANMKYLALRQIWQQKYGIPLSKQLLIPTDSCVTIMSDTISNLPIKVFPTLRFCLFDKRNTITFDKDTKSPKIAESVDIKKTIKKRRMVLIKYFDVFTQEMVPLQILFGEHDVMTIGRLRKYVECEFIATTSEQKSWHSKLLKSFKKMNNIAPYHQKMIVYTEMAKKVYPANNPIAKLGHRWWPICIFQLNPKHPSFSKRKFPTIQQNYALLTK